jgi:protein-tyrosine phosphatase
VTELFKVLHVCTGNICRSPMGEQLMRAGFAQRLGDRASLFVVESAGTMGFTGEPMQPFASSTLMGYGVDGSAFRARLLEPHLVADADLVLGATREHRAAAVTMHPRGARRIFTVREFDRLLEQVDPTSLPAADPVTRARAVVEAAASARGLVRPDAPEDDDITDPYRCPEEDYLTCGRLLFDSLQRPLDLLAG